jgi:uncharacterized protein (TIGR02246 family)
MVKAVLYAILLLPLMLVTSCKSSSNSESNTDSNTETFRSMATDFTSAWNKHDPHALADFWADDGDLLSPWSNVFKGKKNIEKHFAEEHADQMKNSKIQLIIQNVRLIDPNTAFVDAELTLTGMTVAGIKADPFHDHAAFLFVKQDGHWKILIARPF